MQYCWNVDKSLSSYAPWKNLTNEQDKDKISLSSASDHREGSLHIISRIKPGYSLPYSLYDTSAVAAQNSWVLGDIDPPPLDLGVAGIERSRFDSDEDFSWSGFVDFANAESERCLSRWKNESKVSSRHRKDGAESMSEREREVVQ